MGEERQTRLANIIDAVGDKAKYDKCVKALLSNKSILAWILKCCVKEFADCDLAKIAECIEGTPDIATKAVHKNEADVPLDGNEEIRGDNTEDSSITEQTITYDIRFTAIVPDTKEIVELLINVEAQKKDEGYPLEKRVIYYLSRLISGQYGTVFKHSHYEKIQKVYSIWFCGGAPNYKKNTISGISMRNDAIFGNVSLNHEAVDLMQGVIVNLGEAEEKVDSDILNLMNTLLSSKVSETEKKRVMQEDFNIIMTEELESEVSDMCNLSQGIWDSGIEKGKKEQSIENALKMIADGQLSLEKIAQYSGLTLEEVKELADKRTA